MENLFFSRPILIGSENAEVCETGVCLLDGCMYESLQ